MIFFKLDFNVIRAAGYLSHFPRIFSKDALIIERKHFQISGCMKVGDNFHLLEAATK